MKNQILQTIFVLGIITVVYSQNPECLGNEGKQFSKFNKHIIYCI